MLNDSKGQILDDDSVITTLETLKKEASDISLKVQETDKTMNEIEMVSQQYMPLSTACSSIYFTLDALHQVHFLYQYSLQFFLDMFTDVLTNNPRLGAQKDYATRLSIITTDLYQLTYGRVARGMVHHDRLTFAILLARIHLKGLTAESIYDPEFQFMLRDKEGVIGTSTSAIPGLTPEQTQAMVRLCNKLPAFRNLESRIGDREFMAWLQDPKPEVHCPQLWESEKQLSAVGKCIYKLLVIQAFRPDRLVASAALFVNSVLGDGFLGIGEREADFKMIVEEEVKANTPLLLCASQGFDASARVDDLAAEINKPISAIAIGSAEGFSQAEKAINSASKNGRWVLLKNVHLAPGWLVQLEKKLHQLHPHPQFRLFLTMEISPRLPVNLLRAGRIFVFEPPPGIRANLLRTFNTVSASRMMRAPNERARLYFLLAWFHAITQERLRYAPLGWAKRYEFNESDLRVACDTLDTWIEATAMGRTNLPPEKVPWDALSTLMAQCIYGGKIDNEFDQRLLASFLEKLFTAESFNPDFELVVKNSDGGETICMPEGIRRDQFLHWIEALGDRQTPSWLGLPNNAENVLLTTRGTALLASLLKMTVLEDDDELAYSGPDEAGTSDVVAYSRPSWMVTTQQSATTWLSLLPETVPTLRRTLDNIKDPLYRYFEREVNSGAKLLRRVRTDLSDVILICKGEKKQTNYHRTMVSNLVKGMIPDLWLTYTVPKGATVSHWVTDLAHRMKQLKEISQCVAQFGAGELKNITVWLGGLFNPEAYITATRQCIAQANSWSLEELKMHVTVADDENATGQGGFNIRGLKLQGGECRNNILHLSTQIINELPLTTLWWVRDGEDKQPPPNANLITLPVYLDSTRTVMLFTIDLYAGPGLSTHSFYERGVAVISSTSLN